MEVMIPVVKYSDLSPTAVLQYVEGHEPLGEGLFRYKQGDFHIYTLVDDKGWAQLSLTANMTEDIEEFGEVETPGGLYLDDMYAYPQRHGYGSRLMRLVLPLQTDRIWMHTNHEAIGFYKQFGFEYYDEYLDCEKVMVQAPILPEQTVTRFR